MNFKNWKTIPNLLSLFRILLIPVFVVVYFNTTACDIAIWPIVVLAISGLTDLCDGFIARHFNQVSDLGKVLDPAADKLTQAAVIACLSIRFHALLILLGVYVVKEIAMLLGGVVLLKCKNQVPYARWYGKIATFEMYAAMLLFLLFPKMPPVFVEIIMWVSIVLILFAMIMYFVQFFVVKKKQGEKPKA